MTTHQANDLALAAEYHGLTSLLQSEDYDEFMETFETGLQMSGELIEQMHHMR